MQRNLISYIYPRTNGHWRRTIEHLVRCWDQFTGVKVITVAVDACCEPHESVINFLGDLAYDVTWLLIDNVPGLHETAAFMPMLEHVIQQPGITFYCHSKGSTHQDPNAASHLWREAMATASLYYPKLIDCVFESGKNICGSFRTDGPWMIPGYHFWHFAGTWFWFRNSRAKELPWRDLQLNFMGVEGWPGIFPRDEAFTLFYEHANSAALYDVNFWESNIQPSLKYWKMSMEEAVRDTVYDEVA